MAGAKNQMKDGFPGQRMVYIPGAIKKRISEDPRIKDLYITHIGYFPNAQGHYRHREFGCSQYIYIYCNKGEGWIEIEGKKQIIRSNTAFVIPPNTRCTYGASKAQPWNNYWIHFTGYNASFYTPLPGKVHSIPHDMHARIDDRIILFDEMLTNLELHSNFDNVIYANICLKYYLTSVRQIDNYRFSGSSESPNQITLAITYMNNHLKDRITLEELSEACRCSKSNLYKLFKRDMHCAPLDYFIQLKMQRACRNLTNTERKVKDIARDLGYEDPYYFSRLFSKTIGKSPTEYRIEDAGIVK